MPTATLASSWRSSQVAPSASLPAATSPCTVRMAANGSFDRVPRQSDSKIPSRSPAASMAARASSIPSDAASPVDDGTDDGTGDADAGTGADTTGGVITGRAGASDTTVAGAPACRVVSRGVGSSVRSLDGAEAGLAPGIGTSVTTLRVVSTVGDGTGVFAGAACTGGTRCGSVG